MSFFSVLSPVVSVPVVVVVVHPLDPSLMAGLGVAQQLRGRGHEVIPADGGQRPGGQASGARGQAGAASQGRVDHSAQRA